MTVTSADMRRLPGPFRLIISSNIYETVWLRSLRFGTAKSSRRPIIVLEFENAAISGELARGVFLNPRTAELDSRQAFQGISGSDSRGHKTSSETSFQENGAGHSPLSFHSQNSLYTHS